MRPCDAASVTGRRRAKLRRSPFTAYCRDGKVTLRPAPPRRSQMAKPISFSPSSGPSVKCSSASASLPGGLVLALGMKMTVRPVVAAMMSSLCKPALFAVPSQPEEPRGGRARTTRPVRLRG